MMYNFSVLFSLYREIYFIIFFGLMWEIVEESPVKLCYFDFLHFEAFLLENMVCFLN
jgi:hypothetical protein